MTELQKKYNFDLKFVEVENGNAMQNLGDFYKEKKDYDKMKKYYLMAVEKGYTKEINEQDIILDEYKINEGQNRLIQEEKRDRDIDNNKLLSNNRILREMNYLQKINEEKNRLIQEEKNRIWVQNLSDKEYKERNRLIQEEQNIIWEEYKRDKEYEKRKELDRLREEEQDRILEEENSLIEEQNNLLEENNRLLREMNYSQQKNEQDRIWEQYKRDKEYEERNAYKNASWYQLGYSSEKAYTNSIFGSNKRR